MCTSDRAPALLRRDGFTLVEIVIALMITGLFAGFLFQLIQGHGSFVALQGAREEVQQNSRAALEVIASELRAVTPQGLVRGDADVLEFQSPRVFGLACAGGNATQLDIVVPAVDRSLFVVGGATGLRADLTAAGTRVYSPAIDAARAAVTAIDSIPPLGPGNNCAALQPSGAGLRAYRLRGTNFPAPVPAGNVVFLYDLVRYDVGESDGYRWVRRGNTVGAQQPFVGPLVSGAGLRFRYYANTSATPVSAPGTSSSNLQQVDRIEVLVNTRSRGASQRNVQTQRDSLNVFLRNQ